MPPRVKQYMSTTIVTVSPLDSVAHLRKQMLRHDVDKVLVVEDGRLEGIVTATDLLRIFSSPNLIRRPLDLIPVREIMTRHTLTVHENASVDDAARIMVTKNVGSLPVVDDEENVIGIISRMDVLQSIRETGLRRNHVVQDVMDPDPPQVSPFHTIYHVAEVMESRPYGKVIVVDNGMPTGIISRRDIVFLEPSILVRRLDQPYTKKEKPLPKGRVGGIRTYIVPIAMDVMTENPVTIHEARRLWDAVEQMTEKTISFLPVVDDDGKLKGALSALHILAVNLGMPI